MDDTTVVIDALRNKFPALVLKEDICYATQNRQQAVKAMTALVDLVLVLGSSSSSNSTRLREVAQSAGVKAVLIDQVQTLLQNCCTTSNALV